MNQCLLINPLKNVHGKDRPQTGENSHREISDRELASRRDFFKKTLYNC